jgi:pSer/pThr/pTyr-binding forkhead associated (FHA) protein
MTFLVTQGKSAFEINRMPYFRLKILVGPHARALVAINHDFFVIGRAPGCHLIPRSDLISRHHCVLIRRINEIILRDLASTNGTVVNGVLIGDDVNLVNGDLIEIGKLKFELAVSPSTNLSSALREIAKQNIQDVIRQRQRLESQTNPAIETRQSMDELTFESEAGPKSMSVTNKRGMKLFKFAEGGPIAHAFKQLREIFSRIV